MIDKSQNEEGGSDEDRVRDCVTYCLWDPQQNMEDSNNAQGERHLKEQENRNPPPSAEVIQLVDED